MKSAIEKLNTERVIQWPDFFSIISTELEILEENLVVKLPVKNKFLKEVISYIFLSGGKRFRPAISLLIAKATGGIKDKHITVSEITELIHTASLIHDDIIDSAKLRRGKETINSLWNDKISVIAGDFLFGQASVKLGELENTEIVKIYAHVLSNLCDGEIEQYSLLFNPGITLENYIHKSTAKTASLFAACCKSSAMLNNQDSKIIKQCNDFGLSLGIAFQVVDDILDFTSSSNESGKDVCSDLKNGLITAPALFALTSTDERAKQVKILIENRFNNHEKDFDKAIRLIFELGGCEKARQLAINYIERAKENLNFIKESDIRRYLIIVAESVIEKIKI
ncbi:MAG: hypothetical protein A3I68_06990 [Candidatus Melainabacteria bacterium RIFCSPLOWO2_02_FULL_35_15]|nr:MAG: hypothetical protein A3I68_06990 [Candidatus Melainabacteria bacterium RIFCSPLOWO2_02_FULL_35_15]